MCNKASSVILAITFVIPVFATSITKTYTFSQNDLSWEKRTIDGVEYDYPILEGSNSRVDIIGALDLPTKCVSFVIPFNEYVTKLKITSTNTTTIDGSKDIAPVQPIPDKDGNCYTADQEPSYYRSTYPGQVANLVTQDWFFGYHCATICLYPLAYNPIDSQTILYTSISVELVLESGNTPDVYPSKRDTFTGFYDLERSVRLTVENPSSVPSYRPTGLQFTDDTLTQYLIICPLSLTDEFHPLADWYTRIGIKTEVVPYPECINMVGGRDAPEKLRNYLRGKYNSSSYDLEYVLLVGDYDLIPPRNNFWDYVDQTDLYYADLDGGDWDDDNDGLYGEFRKNSIPHLAFPNDYTGWAFATKCYKTTNGGQTWTQKTHVGDTLKTCALDFPNDTLGWLCTQGSRHYNDWVTQGKELFQLYRTTDGGQSWEMLVEDMDKILRPSHISAVGVYHLWVMREPTKFIKYRDSSGTWFDRSLDSNVYLRDMKFLTGNYGWAVGDNCIYKTFNGGSDWTKIPDSCFPTGCASQLWYSIYLADSSEAWVAGWKEYIIHTEDAGNTWELQYSSSSGSLNDIDFRGDTGWAVGDNGRILYTYNGGDDWDTSTQDVYCGPWDEVAVLSGNKGVLSSRNSAYIYTNPSGTSGPNNISRYNNATFWGPDTSRNDVLPDVAVGRASVDGAAEARVFVEKVLAYSKYMDYRQPPPDNFGKKMLCLISDWGATNKMTTEIESNERMITRYLDYAWVDTTDLANFNFTRLYHACDPNGSFSTNPPLTPDNAIAELDKGHNIVLHVDHGGGNWLEMGSIDSSVATKIWNYDAKQLYNYPSIFFTNSCHSGCFILDQEHPETEGFGEEMIRNSKGGAVAYIGSIRSTGISHSANQREFFLRSLFTDKKMTRRTLGYAFSALRAEFPTSAYNWHLLGDPAMDVWTDVPTNLSVSHAKQRNTGSAPSLTVTVTSASNNVDSAKVCVRKEWESVYDYTLTNSSGSATFSLNPQKEGPLFITVTKHNYKPYTGRCWIGDTASYLDISFEEATRGYNTRKVAVDNERCIHISYEVDTNRILYAYSSDSGKTWGLVDTINGNYPALALNNSGRPYMVYLNTNNEARIRNVWNKNEKTILSGKKFTTQPTFSINPYNSGLVGIYNGYGRIELSMVDINWIDSTTSAIIAEKSLQLPQTADNSIRPASIADNTTGGFYVTFAVNNAIYIYRPMEQAPIKVPDIAGNQPTINFFDNTIFLTYCSPNQDTLYAKKGESPYSSFNWKASEVVHASNTSIHNPQCAGLHLVTWDEGNPNDEAVYSSFRNGSSWSNPTQLSPNGLDWAKYPQIDFNSNNSQSAVIWTQKTGEDSLNIGVDINPEDTTGSNECWRYVDLITPTKGKTYRLYSNCDVDWVVNTKNTASRYTILSFREEDPTPTYPSPETHIVDDSFPTPYSTYTSYTRGWKVGEYIEDDNLVVLEPPSSGMYYNCYFDARLITDSGAATDRGGPFNIKYGLWKLSPECGPYPTDTTKWKGNQPKWTYAGDIYETTTPGPLFPGDTLVIPWGVRSVSGLTEAKLEYSVDNGATWDTTNCIVTTADSALVDTLLTSSNTLYRYDYSDTFYWLIPQELTSACLLQMIAEDSASRKDTILLSVPFPIALSGTTANMTRINQRMIDVGKTSGRIGMVYQGEESINPIIYYTESNKGWALDQPDSLGVGTYPVQRQGCVFWMHQPATTSPKDSIIYSGWDERTQQFTAGCAVADGAENPGALSVRYAVPDVVIDRDTVNMLTMSKVIKLINYTYYTYITLMRYRFPKNQPGITVKDSIPLRTIQGTDTSSLSTISAALQGDNLLLAFSFRDTCYYAKTPLAAMSLNDFRPVGRGFHPNVSGSYGNITYTCLSSDSGSLLRLWRYRDDTVWVERDTISLDYDASCMTASEGLLYGIQQSDTVLSHQYIYDPLSEQLLKEETYPGYYSHPFLDTDTSFNRVTSYTWEYDSASYCFMTDRTFLNGIYPALYIESDDRRSPYTIIRDTCIHYAEVDVDSASDSLKYVFPYLNTSNNYTLLVEFYTECDSATGLQIKVGSAVDTLAIPGGGEFSWYETDIPSGTDSLKLTIKRISGTGFVPVSRVIVRHRTTADMYTMGKQGRASTESERMAFCLYQPYPNPFTDAATIRFSVPYATRVNLKVYDITGRLVTRLVEGEVEAGFYALRWEGRDYVNRRCASGVYFVRFEADDYVATKKMVLVK